MHKIGIATYHKLPELSVDDQLLRRELEARGHQIFPVIWNDESIQYTQFDLLVIRSCWDYYLQLPEFLGWVKKLRDLGTRLMNPPETVLWNSNKAYLRELEAAGVRIPRTHWMMGLNPGQQELSTFINESGWKKAVLKPLVSAGAHQTFVITSDKASAAPSLSGEYMLQEFLPEIQTAGEYSFFYFGGAFSHAVVKKPKSGDFRVQPEHGGLTTPFYPCARQLTQAQEILKKVPVKFSYARVDTVERGEHLLLMEIELIEPNLFFGTSPGSEKKFADMIEKELLVKPIGQTK